MYVVDLRNFDESSHRYQTKTLDLLRLLQGPLGIAYVRLTAQSCGYYKVCREPLFTTWQPSAHLLWAKSRDALVKKISGSGQ